LAVEHVGYSFQLSGGLRRRAAGAASVRGGAEILPENFPLIIPYPPANEKTKMRTCLHGLRRGTFPRLGGKIPFQIGAAKSRFVKPHIKISKVSNPLLMDDCPINWNSAIVFSFLLCRIADPSDSHFFIKSLYSRL